MNRVILLAVIGGGLLLLARGCDWPFTDSVTQAKQADHQKMIEALEKIRVQSRTHDDYFEEESIENGYQMLETATDADLQLQYEVNWQMGDQLLRLGRVDQAIKHLERAYALAPQFREEYGEARYRLLLRDMAVGYLRLAETENCVYCRTGESCILPIGPSGVHKQTEGATKAIEYFRLLLKEDSDDLSARWLLNIAYMTLGQYPDQVPLEFLIPPETFRSCVEFPRFLDVAEKVGLKAIDCSGGAIADDFDNDGDIDLITSTWDRGKRLQYFENLGGHFRERGEEASFTGLYGGLNLVQADYDNDGDVDVLVLRGAWLKPPYGNHPNSLLQNDGTGRFLDVTLSAGLAASNHPTQTASWADFDGDGNLDLYIGNENTPSQLFKNNGNGTFTDVAKQAGVENKRFAKGVVWGDYDNDDDPDLYVSNLGGANRLYRNDGDVKFTDVSKELNVEGPRESFPVWFWDYDNDDALDLYVPSYQAHVKHIAEDYLGRTRTDKPDCLYRRTQNGYQEVAEAVKLTRATQPMGCNFGDLDNDGFLDLYLGTGYVDYTGLMPNLMFRNDRGQEFVDVTMSGGFGHLQKGHGIAWADFDQDGDLDIFAQMGGANPGDAFGNVLFENPGFGNHWLAIKLIGHTSNRSAIGARICLSVTDQGSPRKIYRRVNSGGSFGANPLQQHIGIGRAEQIDSLEIYWPTSQETQRFENLSVNQFVEIHEGESKIRSRKYESQPFRESSESQVASE